MRLSPPTKPDFEQSDEHNLAQKLTKSTETFHGNFIFLAYKEEAPVTCVCVSRSGHPAEQLFTYKEEAPVTCVCVSRSGHAAEQRCPELREHAKRANSVAQCS